MIFDDTTKGWVVQKGVSFLGMGALGEENSQKEGICPFIYCELIRSIIKDNISSFPDEEILLRLKNLFNF